MSITQNITRPITSAITRAITQAGEGGSTAPAYAGPRAGYYNAATGAYNLTSTSMANWKAALSDADTNYARLNFYGDSITVGHSTGGAAPLRQHSHVTKIRNELDALYGAAGTGVEYWSLADGDDARVVKSGTWGDYPFGAFGVYGRYSNVPGTYIEFGPVTCDTFIVHTFGTVGAGPMGISIDGGAVTNYPNFRTPNGPLAVTIPAGSLGSHTLRLSVVSGAVWIETIEAVIGTAGVRTTRMALGGALAQWLVEGTDNQASSTTTGSLPFAFDLFPPDLSVIEFGTNEFTTHATVASFKAHTQTIIDKAKTFGDVLLVVPLPKSDIVSTPTMNEYGAALYDLADDNNVALIDFYDLWGTYAAHPTWYNDGIHPSVAGQQEMADRIFAVVHDAVLAL